MVRPPVGGSTSPSPLLVPKELQDLPKVDTNFDLAATSPSASASASETAASTTTTTTTTTTTDSTPLSPPLPRPIPQHHPAPAEVSGKTYYSASGNLQLTVSPALPGLEEEGKGLRVGDTIDVKLILAQLEGKVENGIGPRWEEVELRLVGNSVVHAGLNDSHDFLLNRYTVPITSSSPTLSSPLLSPPSSAFPRPNSPQDSRSPSAQWSIIIPENMTCTCRAPTSSTTTTSNTTTTARSIPSSYTHHSFSIGYSLQIYARGRRRDNSPVMDKLVLRFRVEQPPSPSGPPLELEPPSATLLTSSADVLEGWKSAQLRFPNSSSLKEGEEALDQLELAYKVSPSKKSPQRTAIDYHLSYAFRTSSTSFPSSCESPPPISSRSLSHITQTPTLAVHSRVILNRANQPDDLHILPKLPLAGTMEKREEGRWVKEGREGTEVWFWRVGGSLEVIKGETRGVEVCNAAVRYSLSLRVPEKTGLNEPLEVVANNVALEVEVASGTIPSPFNSLGLGFGANSITSSPASSRAASPALSDGTGFARPFLRQHSRSSSQLATLSSFTFSPTTPIVPFPSIGASPPRKPRPSPGGLAITTSSPENVSNGKKRREPIAFAVGDDTSSSSSGDEEEGVERKGHGALLNRSQTLPVSSSDLLPPTEPGSAATISFPDTSPSFAQIIQQKRRQASAPYFASARSQSLFSPGAGFGLVSAIESGNGRGGWSGPWGTNGAQDGRTRSRVVSRSGSSVGLGQQYLNGEEGPGMVMTPTTEEWRQLGGQLSELADIRARDEARLGKTEDGTASNENSTPSTPSTTSSIDVPAHPPLRKASSAYGLASPPLHSFPLFSPDDNGPSTPPLGLVKSSFSYQTSRTGFTHNASRSLSTLDSIIPATAPIPSSEFQPTHRAQTSESAIRPNLTRGSLQSTTGTPIPSLRTSFTSVGSGGEDSPGADEDEVDVDEPQPVSLDWIHSLGPVKPNRYSAITGMRSIVNFEIEGEAGKGAYGTVRKGREKDTNGEPFGPQLIIKYIVKQRILADCWKKHNILGPIPIEIHVLDHLRRVPYVPRQIGRRRPGGGFRRPLGIAQRRDSVPSLKEGTVTGHPNICGMLDFFEDGEFYYLIMPQAGVDPTLPSAPSGQDLFDYVDVHPDGLEPSVILRIFSQIADALYFLHLHGIVHRDIKDENIVLDHQGNVQLIDFGSAAYVKEGRKFDTFSGTLDFAAPEVLRGQRYGGKETDIWALGVLGYVLICGECPFWSPDEAMHGLEPNSRAELALRSKSTSSSASSASFQSDSTPPIGVMEGSGLMSDAVDLVMRCLEVDPLDRPSSDEILDHKFVLGHDGWRGHRGWLDEFDVD